MIKKKELLTAIADSIRQSRRNFLQPFDFAHVDIDEEVEKLRVRVMDNGQQKVFDIYLKDAEPDANP